MTISARVYAPGPGHVVRIQFSEGTGGFEPWESTFPMEATTVAGGWQTLYFDLVYLVEEGYLAGYPHQDAVYDRMSVIVSQDGADTGSHTFYIDDIRFEGEDPRIPTLSELGGRVVNGYISGARVYQDQDGDGVYDAGEPSATTDLDGSYELTIVDGGGSLIAEPLAGTVDQSTGATVTSQFSAPSVPR